jgi:hypothetical protein
MNTKVSVVFSIIAAAPTVVNPPPTIVNLPATFVNPCLLGTIPETTLTGTTVCLLPTYGGYGRGFGHG